MARKSAEAFARQKEYQYEYNRLPSVKARRNLYVREWCKANPQKRFMRYFRHRLKKKYGMTPEQFYELANAFDGKCFICAKEMVLPDKTTRIRNGRSAVVDHCHERNSVRGVICNDCNRAIGFLGNLESVKRAAIYIECFNEVIDAAS